MNPRVRLSAGERREQIVGAVLRIIGERGVTSLSTANLAREVGVTTGALFRHFETLDEVLRAVVRHALERIEATFPDESLEPRTRLFELALNRVRLLQQNPGLSWILRSEQAQLSLPADSVRSLREMVKKSRLYVLNTLRQGVREGSFRSDIEEEALLVMVMGTIHTLAGMSGLHGGPSRAKSRDPEPVLRALLRMLCCPAREDPATF